MEFRTPACCVHSSTTTSLILPKLSIVQNDRKTRPGTISTTNLPQSKKHLDDLHTILDSEDLTAAEKQLCERLLAVLAHSFKENVAKYLKVQEKFRDATREKVLRQLRVAYPNAPEQEIEDLRWENGWPIQTPPSRKSRI